MGISYIPGISWGRASEACPYDPNRTASDGSSLVGNRQQVAANANVGSQTVPKARRSGRAVRALVLLNVVLATVFVTLLILGRV